MCHPRYRTRVYVRAVVAVPPLTDSLVKKVDSKIPGMSKGERYPAVEHGWNNQSLEFKSHMLRWEKGE
jgi:hypothetical protein